MHIHTPIFRTLRLAGIAAFCALLWLPVSLSAQKTTVEKPVTKPKAVATQTPEIVTSVAQVLDVKQTDAHFEALQSLIERYGIGGLTKNKRFNANSNLKGSDLASIDKSVRSLMDRYLGNIQLPPAEIRKWFPLSCPLDLKRVTYSEKLVADYLQCSYGPGSLEDLNPAAATLTRSRFVIFLAEALSNADVRISALEAKALKAVQEAKKTGTPTPKPKP